MGKIVPPYGLAVFSQIPGSGDVMEAYAELCSIWMDELSKGTTLPLPSTEQRVRHHVMQLRHGVNKLLAEINQALGYAPLPRELKERLTGEKDESERPAL